MGDSWSKRWLLFVGAVVVVALTWASSAQWAASQELKPQFSTDECPVPQGGYVDNGSWGGLGGAVCKYHKEQGGNPSLDNWKSLYVTYYTSPEEALDELRSDFLTDDHLEKFLCESWNDCDRIDRVLLERTDSSMYGYLNTLSNDPINYSLERRFAEGNYTATIFVQGELFAGVEQAMAEVTELETAARAMIDAPREMDSPQSTGTAEAHGEAPTVGPEPTEESPTPGPEIDETKVGTPCDEYCKSLEPIGFWLDGETYPDCTCDCGPGNTYVGLQCVPCSEWCTGEGTRLVLDRGRPCGCMCTDPNQKWDPLARVCVGVDGSECNGGNGCEPEFGENCSNCADCGCSFGSPANRIYDERLTCDPANPRADIFGCVFDIPSEAEQLEIMREEEKQCRWAYGLMIFASNSGAVGYRAEVMNAMTSLSQVTTWQQKSGCIPVDGVILGREAVDPTICVIRYCDRIRAGIHELEQRVEGQTPVIRGPAIKVSPPGANVSIGPGQTVQFEGRVSIHGERPASLQSPVGAGFAHSEYEIVHDPDSGMTIYLFEGGYTHTYYDAAEDVAKQEVLRSGEMLSVGLDGVPIARLAFDPASRDPWWEGVGFLVDCPENAYQEGPDCYCVAGFAVDPWLERCVPVEMNPDIDPTEIAAVATNPPPMVQVTVTPAAAAATDDRPADQEGSGDDNTQLLLIVLGILAALIVALVVVLVVLVRRRR